MYSITTKFLISILLVVLILVLIFRNRITDMVSGREGFRAFTHERASVRQNQDTAKILGTTMNLGAHMNTTITSTGNLEVLNNQGKQIYDEYSAAYSDCKKANLSNIPNGCILCLDPSNGKILERTIVGPGNQSNNYFTPCPCPVKDVGMVRQIRKALICQKIKGPYGIVGTDCSYKFDGPGIGQGHGVLMNGSEPVLKTINTSLNGECVIPFKDITTGARNSDGNVIILPPSEATSRDTVAEWISSNYPESQEIDMCMPELNENNNTMTKDCAEQIYFKYGKEGGSGDPSYQENYERIMETPEIISNPSNIPNAYETLLKSKAQELEN
jgi:hypothetical protein